MSDSCCQKEIDVRVLQVKQRRTLIIVLGVNAATFVMMIIGALVSGSSSLLSGGLDNLGDAVTYALSLAVVGASQQAKARVALFKGLLILTAASVVGGQIAWRLLHPSTPIVDTMGLAAILNLLANLLCLWLLSPHRKGDVNMASAWECSQRCGRRDRGYCSDRGRLVVPIRMAGPGHRHSVADPVPAFRRSRASIGMA